MNNLGIVASSISGSKTSTSSYESIATATGTGSSASVTFSSIPSTYSALQIRAFSKSTYTTSAFVSEMWLSINGDTGLNYTLHNLRGNGTAASATGLATGNYGYIPLQSSMSAGTGLTNMGGVAIWDIQDYASTTKRSTVRAIGGADANGTVTGYISMVSGLWNNTAAVSSLTFTVDNGSLATSTTFALYGIK